MDGLMMTARGWRKQRHTAKRIWERLVCEHSADVSYGTVRRYVKDRRQEVSEHGGCHQSVFVIVKPAAGGAL
jgi:hypothetical protein